MGIPYEIVPESPLYRALAEFRKEKWGEIQTEKRRLLEAGERNFVIISGVDKESVKVNAENIRYI